MTARLGLRELSERAPWASLEGRGEGMARVQSNDLVELSVQGPVRLFGQGIHRRG